MKINTVELPRSLIEAVDQVIATSGRGYGFRSRADFVRYAARRLVEQLDPSIWNKIGEERREGGSL